MRTVINEANKYGSRFGEIRDVSHPRVALSDSLKKNKDEEKP